MAKLNPKAGKAKTGGGSKAERYLSAAESLLPALPELTTPHEHLETARCLVAGFVLENTLSAFLAHAGAKAKEIKQPGHNLLAQWDAARSYQLSLPKKHPQWLKSIAGLHGRPYEGRYQQTSHATVLCAFEPMFTEITGILAMVRAAISKSSASSASATRWNTTLLFLTSSRDEEPIELKGAVLKRTGGMVLEIPPKDPEYLLVGKRTAGYYEAENSAHGSSKIVHACWCKAGDEYLGMWVEDGTDYLFRFGAGGAHT